MTINSKKLGYFVLIIAAIFLSSCKSGFRDQPQTFFRITKGPQDGEKVFVSIVAFEWKASVDKAEYRYRMIRYGNNNSAENYIEMTSWSNTTKITFENLDEGKYRFYVEARYNAWNGSDMRTFVVDAIRGPLVTFYRNSTVAKMDEDFAVSIWIEDVDSVAVASFDIHFDYTTIEFLGANLGELVVSRQLKGYILPNFADENNRTKAQVNATGKISVTLGVIKDESRTNSPSMISGSGKIIDLRFRAFAKPVNYESIEFLRTDLRNLKGNVIIARTKDGTIKIE